MSLTQAQITHLAKLTALHPTIDLEISSILNSFDSLASIDTSHITSVSRSGKDVLILRDDSVQDSGLTNALLASSNQKKAAHQIVLSGIMVGE